MPVRTGTAPFLTLFLWRAFFCAYFGVKKITFNELHIYRDVLSEYRYFIITGVCEPVLTYVRYFLDKALGAKGVRHAPKVDRSAFRRLGYDEEMIAEYEEQLRTTSEYFERASLKGLYAMNVFGTPRLCEIDLQSAGASDRAAYLEHMRETDLGDTLLKRAPYGAYCIAYFDSVFDYMDDVGKKDLALMRNIRGELDSLSSTLENEDVRNTGRTSRLLWIDASVWNATRRGMYTWALDLLSDKATEEFLWECTGACGELTMLRGFYDAVLLESDSSYRLGEGMSKKAIRETELYKSLLFVDGRAFGWDVLRFYTDMRYKGTTLRSKVMRSLQIERKGLQGSTYKGALSKCVSYLGRGRRYIEKLFKVRCLLESGALSLTLGEDALRSKECRELCKKYNISMLSTEDLRRASTYDLFVFRDVLRILSREMNNANAVLHDAGLLHDVEDGQMAPVQPLLRVFLALGKHRKLVEKCM